MSGETKRWDKAGVEKDMDNTQKIREKLNKMLDKIDDEAHLNRIYRFVKYIYIHRT